MKISKRDTYTTNLYPAIHTLSGEAEQVNCDVTKNEKIVKTCRKQYKKDSECYWLQLNPNKTVPNSMIKTYSEFKGVLDETLLNIEAENFRITRADMSFNSDETSDYELFKKLNRLLICCIAEAFNITNCYNSFDLWTDKSLSIAIKDDKIEAENYNKELEAHGTTEAKNRLELRSKKMTFSLEEEFLGNWFNRLDLAVKKFEEVQKHYNRELVKIWKTDQSKEKKEKEFISMTAFVIRYKDCIFTRQQLTELFAQLGSENPYRLAKRFKEKHSIEFFSLTDLKVVVKAIKDKMIEYFKN